MDADSRLKWRYGWVLIGLVGLVIWPWLPDAPRESAKAVRYDQPAWIEALWSGEPDGIRAGLEQGAPVDQALGDVGSQALHVLFAGDACRLDRRPSPQRVHQSLDLLLLAGAPVNAADGRGNTPLTLAVSHCDAEVIRRLLGAGADPGRPNGRGLVPFELTLATQSDAADALLEAGYRLPDSKLQHYRRVYHDEPEILALLDRAVK